MTTFSLDTPRLRLVLESTDDILARIDAMPVEHRAQVSPEWVARLRATSASHPWTHGFAMFDRASDVDVGSCAFKGAPGEDGAVEIAYEVHEEFRGRGFAKEAAAALVDFALTHTEVGVVRAHTMPENGASAGVLRACDFKFLGDVIDPEDGPVWRWERRR